jgi:thiol:disulfide interchange protein DsbA
VPAILSNPIFETLARAYYTASFLDKSGTIDNAIYAGIQDERINYTRESLVQQLFAKYGVSNTAFQKTYNSFAVNMEVAKAKVLTNAYGITSTPHVIVNCKNNTYLTNLTMTKDAAVLVQTLNYIIAHDKPD